MNIALLQALGGLGGGGELWPSDQKINLINNSLTCAPYFFNTINGASTLVKSLEPASGELQQKNIIAYEKIIVTTDAVSRFLTSRVVTEAESSLSAAATGTTIKAGVWLKKTGTFNGLINLSVSNLNSVGSPISYPGVINNITLTDTWTLHTFSFAKPSGMTFTNFLITILSINTSAEIDIAAPFVIISNTRDYDVYVNYTDIDNKSYFFNKKIAFFGDSILVQNSTLRHIPLIISQTRGYKDWRSYAISGSTLTSIQSHSGEEQYNNMVTSGFSPDILIIEMSTNDFGNQVAIGNISSTNKNELYGAYNNILTLMATNYPNCKIAISTPTQRGDAFSLDKPVPLSTYQQAIIDYCNAKNLIYIDNYNCGILSENERDPYQYTVDGLHPTVAGGALISNYMASKILLNKALL